MSLTTSPSALIAKYGQATTLDGSSAGKAYWKSATIARAQMFLSETKWGKMCWDVWFLPTASPQNGQTISRGDGDFLICACAPMYVAGVLAYTLCLAYAIEEE